MSGVKRVHRVTYACGHSTAYMDHPRYGAQWCNVCGAYVATTIEVVPDAEWIRGAP